MLQPLRRRYAGRLSGGEQQMLTIARCLMGNPAVLLLDEPSEGLAPLIVQEIGRLIRSLRELGTTIVLAEQNSRFCLGVATRVAVIDKGAIVWAARWTSSPHSRSCRRATSKCRHARRSRRRAEAP
jgi:branched-chain amino acid transport system ATP-binding protein